MVTTRKVILHGGVNVSKTVGEYEFQDIVSSGRISDMLYPFSHVGLPNEFLELRRGSLDGTDLVSNKVSCRKFCFSMDEYRLLERLNEVRKLKVVF